MGLFKRVKKTQQTEGELRDEELAVISSVVAGVLQSTPKTSEFIIKRIFNSPWKLMGIKDLMVYGKQRRRW
jgi:hypothetical protein